MSSCTGSAKAFISSQTTPVRHLAPRTFVRFQAETSLLAFATGRKCVMKRVRLLIALGMILVGAFTVAAKSKTEKQAEARKKADATLQRLYKEQPSAQAAARSGVGYAVFNRRGAKILVAGAGRGKGLAGDNKKKKFT